MTAVNTTVNTKQARIALIQSSGDGLPVVMIHGSGSSKGVFARQFESPLAQSHRLIALDLPGHGESSDAAVPAEGYTVKGFAATVGEVLDDLGIERAAIFGWSLGGHVAIELMTWHPAVAGILVTGTPPLPRGPLGVLRGFQLHRDVLLASKPQFSDAEAERFLHLCFGDTGTPEFLASIKRADGRLRKIVFNGMMRGDGADQRRAVENAPVPVGIVNGADESIARLSFVAGVAYNTLWDGQCHVIEGTGHAPFWQRPDVFNPLLTRFVEDVAAAPAVRTLDEPMARSA